jgi:hypothetical protein
MRLCRVLNRGGRYQPPAHAGPFFSTQLSTLNSQQHAPFAQKIKIFRGRPSLRPAAVVHSRTPPCARGPSSAAFFRPHSRYAPRPPRRASLKHRPSRSSFVAHAADRTHPPDDHFPPSVSRRPHQAHFAFHHGGHLAVERRAQAHRSVPPRAPRGSPRARGHDQVRFRDYQTRTRAVSARDRARYALRRLPSISISFREPHRALSERGVATGHRPIAERPEGEARSNAREGASAMSVATRARNIVP